MNDGGGGGGDLRSCWNILRLGKFGVTTYPLRKEERNKRSGPESNGSNGMG